MKKIHTLNLPSPSSIVTKVEIIGDNKIPEFPLAIPVMLIGIISVIVFYRVKFVK